MWFKLLKAAYIIITARYSSMSVLQHTEIFTKVKSSSGNSSFCFVLTLWGTMTKFISNILLIRRENITINNGKDFGEDYLHALASSSRNGASNGSTLMTAV